MIIIYGMPSCPDCAYIEEQAKAKGGFTFVNIGESPKELKKFLGLRDHDPAFARVREKGTIGIPAFQREDGSITLKAEEFGLTPRWKAEAKNACSLDEKGC